MEILVGSVALGRGPVPEDVPPPLRTVLTGVESAFGRFGSQHRSQLPVSSLVFCCSSVLCSSFKGMNFAASAISALLSA